MPETTTAVTVRDKAATVKTFIFQNVTQIKDALPRIGLTPDAVARAAYTQVLKNPQLLDCDKGSLMKAIIEAAQLGLSFNLGRAYLVPFRNTKKNRTDVQLIPGYLGLLDIARRSGEIASVSARAVYKGDAFTFRFGLEADHLSHDQLVEPTPEGLTHVYAIVRFKTGGYQVVVMTRKQVEAVRARSKASSAGPWVTDYEAMAIKTVLKRVLKLCPASIEMVKALELESAVDEGRAQHLADEMFDTDDDDVIDVVAEDGEEEKPAPSKSATVAAALKGARKKASAATEEAPVEDDSETLTTRMYEKALALLGELRPADAAIAVSEATSGKYQTVLSLNEAPAEVLIQVIEHLQKSQESEQ
jgi:recombination protein RecT